METLKVMCNVGGEILPKNTFAACHKRNDYGWTFVMRNASLIYGC